MGATLHFLGWDKPITTIVSHFILSSLTGPDRKIIDLQHDLIIVPTRQAGRHLREAMTLYCARHNAAMLSARIEEPSSLFRPHKKNPREASATMVKALWTNLLSRSNLNDYPNLFPGPKHNNDFSWAMRMGEMMQNLRNTLTDGGYQISNMPDNTELEEPQRWLDMARLEKAYIDRVEKAGLTDPCLNKISLATSPAPPENINRIIIAAVPDPSLLMIKALEQLAEKITVDILVHAPESMADHFDQWGRPIPAKWMHLLFDIPDPQANIILASSPQAQSRRVIEEISAESKSIGPSDIAIGVPDKSIIPHIEKDLAESGLPAFNPANKIMKDHPAYKLIESFISLVTNNTYKAFSTFLRHHDALNFLEKSDLNIKPRNLLKEIDEFQNKYLPLLFDDITQSRHLESDSYNNLRKASQTVRTLIDHFQKQNPADAIRSFCQTIYEPRIINTRNLNDKELLEATQKMDSILQEFTTRPDLESLLDRKSILTLILRRLGEQEYHNEREKTAIDLEGWLELTWNDAPFLIVTGMNEGTVPQSRTGDAFLPDSLRSILQLRDNASRFARDAFLTRGFIESRRNSGRVCFIAGKTNSAGDPLKPSRIFFRCDDKELPARAELLFRQTDEHRNTPPSTISFKLKPATPEEAMRNLKHPGELNVTSFRDYLSCPFRFYLKHVLKMKALDDQKSGMDARDFGDMIHWALNEMARNKEIAQCREQKELEMFLCNKADHWMKNRYGNPLPLPLMITLDSGKQRLRAAARAHIDLVNQEWEIIQAETEYKTELNGMIIKGRIDRIDRNRHNGAIRIIDYKTSDGSKSKKPKTEHIKKDNSNTPEFTKLIAAAGESEHWRDLQLPLYMFLVSSNTSMRPSAPAFFSIPRSADDTDILNWDGFDDEIMQSAITCAQNIITRIQEHIFWPPAEKVEYDDFANLFLNTSKEAFYFQ